MRGFMVTYERWDDDSSECGETDDKGYEVENTSFRDAVNALGYGSQGTVPSDSCHEHARWITAYCTNDGTREFYEDGIAENRSLYIPDQVTASSRRRICKYLINRR